MTAEEFFKSRIMISSINEDGNYSTYDIEEAIIEFAKLKCKELLEIVSELKESDSYGKFYFDKDSILNAVDLETFIV